MSIAHIVSCGSSKSIRGKTIGGDEDSTVIVVDGGGSSSDGGLGNSISSNTLNNPDVNTGLGQIDGDQSGIVGNCNTVCFGGITSRTGGECVCLESIVVPCVNGGDPVNIQRV